MKRISYLWIRGISRSFLGLCLLLGGFFVVAAVYFEVYDRAHPDDNDVQSRMKARRAVHEDLDKLEHQRMDTGERAPTESAIECYQCRKALSDLLVMAKCEAPEKILTEPTKTDSPMCKLLHPGLPSVSPDATQSPGTRVNYFARYPMGFGTGTAFQTDFLCEPDSMYDAVQKQPEGPASSQRWAW